MSTTPQNRERRFDTDLQKKWAGSRANGTSRASKSRVSRSSRNYEGQSGRAENPEDSADSEGRSEEQFREAILAWIQAVFARVGGTIQEQSEDQS
jgi:hypothetical protein